MMYFVLWILMLQISFQLRISSLKLTDNHQKKQANYVSDPNE